MRPIRLPALLAAILCLIACTGCIDRSTTITYSEPSPSSVQLTVGMSELAAACHREGGFQNATAMPVGSLMTLYGIPTDKVKEHFCFVSMTGAFPSEAVVIRATNEDALDVITEKLQLRLDALNAQAKNYDPDVYALAQECRVLTKGDCAALFFVTDHAKLEELFDGTSF